MTASPDQIALLRGAVAVPDDTELLKAYSRANKGQQLIGAERATFLRHVRIALAATPPAYAEALAAVLDGYEAMQKDAEQDPLQGAVDWLASAMPEFINTVEVQRRLSIGHNRASRLLETAFAKLGVKA